MICCQSSYPSKFNFSGWHGPDEYAVTTLRTPNGTTANSKSIDLNERAICQPYHQFSKIRRESEFGKKDLINYLVVLKPPIQ